MRPNLALGSAQFGLRYGYSDAATPKLKVPHVELGKIINTASLAGIEIIDTAESYGTAIDALGAYSDKIRKSAYKIVTKIPSIDGLINWRRIADIDKNFKSSLLRLGTNEVYCLMVHDANDLLRAGAHRFYDYLVSQKNEGFCRKIGVSVYYPDQIAEISSRYDLDVVQLPTSIFDQRFSRRFLRNLKKLGKLEIHGRSLFLQGMMFAEPNKLPKKFFEIKSALKVIKKMGITPLQASLDYLAQRPEIDHMIVGVHSVQQFSDIILEYRNIDYGMDWRGFAMSDPRIVNPSHW